MKRIISVIAILASVVAAFGVPLTPEQSLSRLRKELPAKRFATVPMKLVYTDSAAVMPTYYIFEKESSADSGYLIAGADDLAAPVLAYIDEGTFDYNTLPAQMRWWLSEYAREISWARSRQASNAPQAAISRPQREPIQSLVHARWDQASPYNNLCPTYNSQPVATGCVATAMAQLLRFWEYPVKGKGSHSYTSSTLKLTSSFNYANTTFLWDKMPFIYNGNWNNDEELAVATLMKACGVAVDMNYGLLTSAGSGASSQSVAPGLINYFDYDPSTILQYRNQHTLLEWENMVYESLKNGCPAYYDGSGSNGGHAFIVDGYSDNGYFHLNWGWSGVSNGYFLLTALNPANLGIGGGEGGFNFCQGAILNMRPNHGGTAAPPQFSALDEYAVTVSGSKITLDASSFEAGFFCNTGNSTISTIYPGIALTSTSGSRTIVTGSYFSNLKPAYGTTTLEFTLPTTLSAGTYTITPIYKISNVVYEMPQPLNMQGRYKLVVDANGNKTVNIVQGPRLSIINLQATTPFYYGSNFGLKGTMRNTSAEEFNGDIYVAFFDASQNFLGVFDAMPVTVPAMSTDELDFYTLTPGLTVGANYYVAIAQRDTGDPENLTLISNAIYFTYQAKQTTVTLTSTSGGMVVENASNVYASDIHVSCNMKCTAGEYIDGLTFIVFDGSTQKIQHSTPAIHVPNGTSKTFEYNFPFDAGEKNHTYTALVGYNKVTNGTKTLSPLNQASFVVGTTGIEMLPINASEFMLGVEGDVALITAPASVTDVEVYSIQGIRQYAAINIDATLATVSLNGLEKGTYLIRVCTKDAAHTFRMMRQ